jgi:uncharacterized protein
MERGVLSNMSYATPDPSPQGGAIVVGRWRVCAIAESSFMLRYLAAVAALSIAIVASAFAVDGKAHHIAIQIDQNDPQIMNLVLNNATNVIEYYRNKHEDVDLDIVAFGPGLHMLRADSSPVQDRVKRLKDMAFPGKIQFSACDNTRRVMEKTEGHPIAIVTDATIVPFGVVHLMELEERGWGYVRQ